MEFSILVPVYNVEKYLGQCVESLLNQTYNGKYEIILVDDGSTDSSGRLCDEYAKNHPEKIRVIHKENEGLVSARQAGIEAAAGEYSLFADSDDFVESCLLSEISSVIAEEKQTDLLIYSFNYFDSGTVTKRKTTLCENKAVYTGCNKKAVYEALITTTLITSLWTKVVRTDILKNDPTDYRLYYDKNMAEDWFRSVQLLTAANKIVYINAPLYNYRTNNESISRSFRPETIAKKNTLYVYDKLRESLPGWGMDTDEYRQKLNARWLNEVVYTFKQYYENASDAKEKKAILNYNWKSMMPEDAGKENNPYENDVNRKLYNWLEQKNPYKIKRYFIFQNIYKNLRKTKAKLLNIVR